MSPLLLEQKITRTREMIMMEDSNGMRKILQTHSSADIWGAAHYSRDDLSH